MKSIGVDGVIGNLYTPTLQLSNTYAFGRLAEDVDTDAGGIIEDFSKLIARPDGANRLAEVLIWLENNSYWEQQLPPDGRLPHLPGDLSKNEALARLREVKPNGSPPRALPVAPEEWLADLQRSIERMDWAV